MAQPKRLAFLRVFVEDCLAGTRKSYKEYAEQLDLHSDKVRRWIRDFKTPSKPEFWYGKYRVEEDWEARVASARNQKVELDKSNVLGIRDIPKPYDGLRPRRVWEAQGKGGTVKVLHSYENPQDLEELQIFKERVITDILDKYREIFQGLTPVELPKPKAPAQMMLAIYTADKHVGACNKRGLYQRAYDPDIFRKRMAATLVKTAHLSKAFGGFDVINFIELGDGLDGPKAQTTRGGHQLTQNLDGHEQFDLYVDAHKGIFDSMAMAGHAKEIRYTVAANDNHGGFAMYTAARTVQEYLNVRYPEMITTVNRDFLFHTEYGIHRHIMTHGKDEQFMNRGWPDTLNKEIIERINQYINYHGLSKHLDFGMEPFCLNLIKGDLHTSKEEFSDLFRYKNIMSMYGSSPWVEHNFGPGYSGFEYEIIVKDDMDTLSGKFINK